MTDITTKTIYDKSQNMTELEYWMEHAKKVRVQKNLQLLNVYYDRLCDNGGDVLVEKIMPKIFGSVEANESKELEKKLGIEGDDTTGTYQSFYFSFLSSVMDNKDDSFIEITEEFYEYFVRMMH